MDLSAILLMYSLGVLLYVFWPRKPVLQRVLARLLILAPIGIVVIGILNVSTAGGALLFVEALFAVIIWFGVAAYLLGVIR